MIDYSLITSVIIGITILEYLVRAEVLENYLLNKLGEKRSFLSYCLFRG